MNMSMPNTEELTTLPVPMVTANGRGPKQSRLFEMTPEEIVRVMQKIYLDKRSLAEAMKVKEREIPSLQDLTVVEIDGEGHLVLGPREKRDDANFIQRGKHIAQMLRDRVPRARFEMLDGEVIDTLRIIAKKRGKTNDSGQSNIFLFYESLLRKAVRLGASDIHILLINNFGNVVYRVNGRLVVETNPRPITQYIEMCNHIYNHRETGGDGNWQPTKSCNCVDNVVIDGQITRWRFHSFPNEDGQHAHIVLRRNNITQPKPYMDVSDWDGVDEKSVTRDLLKLGYLRQHADQILRMFSSPDGGIFIAGKTNSGKTTALNTALTGVAAMSRFQRMVISIEDVPELSVPRSARTPVALDKENALTFEDAIVSALRRDADVIVVGEIRASDSGPAVVQAILSGHMVVASIHTNNIISMLDRLDYLDVPRSFLAGEGNLAGLIWQRLLPTLCPHCRIQVDEDDPAYRRLAQRYGANEDVSPEYFFRTNPDGCEVCNGIPPGRTVACEIIDFPSIEMRSAIHDRDEARLLKAWEDHHRSRGYKIGKRAIDHAVYHAARGHVCIHEVEAQLGRFDRLQD